VNKEEFQNLKEKMIQLKSTGLEKDFNLFQGKKDNLQIISYCWLSKINGRNWKNRLFNINKQSINSSISFDKYKI
jgi:hypothetical protein